MPLICLSWLIVIVVIVSAKESDLMSIDNFGKPYASLSPWDLKVTDLEQICRGEDIL